MVQLRAPEAARGRILSIYMMALGLIYPLGAVVQGWLADSHGVRSVTVVAALVLLALLVLAAVARPTFFTNLGDPPDASRTVTVGGTGAGPADPSPAGGTP